MDDLIERLRYEADISDRPGQMDRLNAIADELASALAAARELRALVTEFANFTRDLEQRLAAIASQPEEAP